MAAFALAGGNAGAETRSSGKRPAAEAPWLDCAKADAAMAGAIEAARSALARSWLENRSSFFATYIMPGEKRNPFDLSPRAPDAGPRDGVVEARPPVCTYRAENASGQIAHHMRFVAPFYRFHESGHGWSPPLRNGLMLEAMVIQTDKGWEASAPVSEQTILLPEQKPTRADEAKLPAAQPWAEPIPGCGKRQTWNGTDCITRKRR